MTRPFLGFSCLQESESCSAGRRKTSALLAVSGPIIIYFLYCLISVAWSPIPGPAFKRWTKAIGDLVMVLIVLTDGQPVAALRRLYSRVGFILFPVSVLLIRYTDLGRGYTPDGAPENTGVTTNKNTLGLIVFIVLLGALWNLRALLIDKEAPNRGSAATGSSYPAYLRHCPSANVALCHRCRVFYSRRWAHACHQSACHQKAAQQSKRAVFGSRPCGGARHAVRGRFSNFECARQGERAERTHGNLGSLDCRRRQPDNWHRLRKFLER